MRFQVSEWDDNDLGDQTHSNLFNKANVKSTKPNKKSTMKEKVKTEVTNSIDLNSEIPKTNMRAKRSAAEKNKRRRRKANKQSNNIQELKNDSEIQKVENKVENAQKKTLNRNRCLKKRQMVKDYKKIAHVLESNPENQNVQKIKNFVERKKPQNTTKQVDANENRNKKQLKKKLKRLQDKSLKNNQNEITEAETITNAKQNKSENKETIIETSENENKKKKQNKHFENEINEKAEQIKQDVETSQEISKKKLKKQLKRLQSKNLTNIQNEIESTESNQTSNKEKSQENKKKLKQQVKRLENKNLKNVPSDIKEEQEIQENNDAKIPKRMLINVLKLKEKLIQSDKIKENTNNPTNPLRARMLAKLKAARFRFINEQIYTNESKAAQKLFQQDPEAFDAYHDGYRQQVAKWPLNPLDTIITAVKKMPSDHIIADFGCGDARLAKSVPHKVYSFDFVSTDPNVVACDMAHCPLKKNQVDVVVFCLSLMGTNLKDYLFEANRVLKLGGILKIAEVESRFEGVEQFIEGLIRFGFTNTWKDLSHNLFYFLNFKKERDIMNKNKLPTISLNPCLYKKR